MTAGWNRRELLLGMGLLSAALGAPALARSVANAPSPAFAPLLREVADLVLPATGTPGAGDAAVGAFVALALEHGLQGTHLPVAAPDPGWPLRADGSLLYDQWLAQELDRRAHGAFLAQPRAQRHLVLAALDADAFPPGPPAPHPSPWATIKALILTGYYTGEIGGSRELRYEPIPGRWDSDVALKKGDRAFSSDWTAVEFG